VSDGMINKPKSNIVRWMWSLIWVVWIIGVIISILGMESFGRPLLAVLFLFFWILLVITYNIYRK